MKWPRVRSFALLFLPLFGFFAILYVFARPYYEPIPMGLANGLMTRLSPPTMIVASSEGGWRSYRLDGSESRLFRQYEPFVGDLVLLGVALLPALLLATPVPIGRRLKLLGLGMVAQVLVNALSLVGLVRLFLCLESSPGDFLCLWMVRLALTSGQLSAATIWALLTWRFWAGELRDSEPRSTSQGT